MINLKLKVDSRKVEKGDTFLAIRGIDVDGHNYILNAIKNGASTIICEEGNYEVETIIVEDTREYLVEYLTMTYKDIKKEMKIIGVTGTNGKTTTSYLIYELLNLVNYKAAYIGTIGFYLDKKVCDLNNTTPDIWDIYDMMIRSYNNGCRYLVLEVSSQALHMKRVEGLLFDFAIFTNLTAEHLDYHQTMENYMLAKQQLFRQLKSDGLAIVNVDDNYSSNFILDGNNNITYGRLTSDYQISSFIINNFKSEIIINNKYKINSSLIGTYNAYNLTASFIVTTTITNDCELISNNAKFLNSPPGRMDIIKSSNNNFIIVDYAHTPDAVLNILKEVNNFVVENIYTVIGCGGNRDKTKRPVMGQIASDYSKKVIFTSDNPRYEKPEDIINDMLGELKKDNYLIEIDRKKAIQKGIDLLKENDVLLVLGKGHETEQITNGVTNYFNDKEEILKYII